MFIGRQLSCGIVCSVRKGTSGYTVISYVNTSAAVKAYTDIVVTSTNARQIVKFSKEEKIIFGRIAIWVITSTASGTKYVAMERCLPST